MKQNKKDNQPTKKLRGLRVLIVILLLLMLAAGVFLMFTPYLENYEHQKEVTQEVTAFNELVAVYRTETAPQDAEHDTSSVKRPYADLYDAMYSYNLEIYHNGQSALVDAWSYQTDVFDLNDYGYGLDSVGIVKIPDISIEMPLYLGATYDNLAK